MMLSNKILYYIFLIGCFVIGYQNAFSQNSSSDNNLIKNWQLFHNQGDYDEAIAQAKRVYLLGESMQNKEIMALARNWEGQSLLKKTKRAAANRKSAEKVFKESLNLSIAIDNKALQMNNLKQLLSIAALEKNTAASDIYNRQINEIEQQIATRESNRNLTEKVERLDSEVTLLGSTKVSLEQKIAALGAAQMRAELMLSMQKNYLDSLQLVRMQETFESEKKEMALKEQATQLELQQSQIQLQQNQIRLQSSQRNFFIAIAAILTLFAIGAYIRFNETKKYNNVLNTKNEALIEEQQRSELLLLNILPDMIAKELKANGITKARRYEQATVMFTDFKDFSRIAKLMPPEQLVADLDTYFKAFDEIVSKYKIEKIKTIGDAYMCVGGLPDVEGSQPKDVVFAALEIQTLLKNFKVEREKIGKPFFEARIGIHSGPLVAGVVGSTKFAYDIWGDTVNIAARLESKGESWRVNISTTTYELVKHDFDCEPRGLIPIKNGNDIAMYFVNAPVHSMMAI